MFNFLINIANAQSATQDVAGAIDNPLKAESIQDLIANLSGYILGIATSLLVLVVVWSGFQLLLHSDEPGARRAALDRIKWAAIGFGIMLLAGGVVSFVKGFLGGTSQDSTPPAAISNVPYYNQNPAVPSPLPPEKLPL